MSDIRPKRSSDELPTNRRQELEEQLAALRDQETVLTRTIELVQAQIAAANKGASGPLGRTASLPARPTADLKDYEARCRQVREEQKRRSKQLWTELRRLVRGIKSVATYMNCFGKPVRETQWGMLDANWAHYRSVIQEPMDLRTVWERLGDDESKRTYSSPSEALRDLRLIHQNAQQYRGHASVTEAANQLESALNSKWRAAQLDEKWATEQQRQQREDQARCLLCCAWRSCCTGSTVPQRCICTQCDAPHRSLQGAGCVSSCDAALMQFAHVHTAMVACWATSLPYAGAARAEGGC